MNADAVVLSLAQNVMIEARLRLEALGLNPRERAGQFLNAASQHAVKHGIPFEQLSDDFCASFDFAERLAKTGAPL